MAMIRQPPAVAALCSAAKFALYQRHLLHLNLHHFLLLLTKKLELFDSLLLLLKVTLRNDNTQMYHTVIYLFNKFVTCSTSHGNVNLRRG